MRAETPRYTHARRTATVFLTSVDADVTGASGGPNHRVHAAHGATWSDGPATRQIRNRGTQPIDAIVVELKMQ